MSPTIDQLKTTLAALPVSEREELADLLLTTLEPADPDAMDAWREELKTRMAEIRSGKVVGKPVEEVLARLREQYP